MAVRKLTEAGGLSLDPRGTGRMLVKIIDVGEGSSAIYTSEALRLAESERVFRAGTHMYLDHAAWESERRDPGGNRSVRDLASVLTSDARWDEQQQALVAEAEAMPTYADLLEGLAPHVGLSISAVAEVDPPETPGGLPVAKRILGAESVDWVTNAGRGGAVMAILESAGISKPLAEAATDDRRDQLQRAIRAAHADPASDTYTWVQDFDDVVRVVWFSTGAQTWQQTYDVAADDRSVTLTGERTEVRPVTQYLPVSSTAGVTEGKDSPMPEISQAELDRLTADAAKLAEAQKRAADAEAALAEATARQAVAEARKSVTDRIAAVTEGENAALVARVTSQIVPTVESEVPADIETRIAEAVKAEKAYLVSMTEGRLTGFGASQPITSQPSQRRTLWDKKGA